jgi:protein O-mannosyl-transferase
MIFLNNIKVRYLYLFLFIFSVSLYYNSSKNEYAFDDDIIVLGNKPVQKGFAGIKEIFSTDMFASYIDDYKVKGNKLSGGRYRPLSITTFAIEQQFIGFSPGPKHWVNIILYAFLIILIFHFVLNDLILSLPVAFITAFLFALHPIHTEVVANLKSRDEILSLIFYLLTISSYLKYIDSKSKKDLLKMSLCFVAALLSKEYAVTLLIVLPVAAYTMRNYSTINSFKSISSLLVIFIIYALIRGSIVGWGAPEQMDVLNNPYVYANDIEKIVTKIFVLLKYFVLLFKPFPLSSDYSFEQIRYRTFADWDVWASLILHSILIYYVIKSILSRKLIGFVGIIYFSNLFLVSNFVFNIGASMGERFLFHSSFAFCLLVALMLEQLGTKLKASTSDLLVKTLLIIMAVASFLIVIPRNRDWKNSHTLFLKDVETSPNSALCNANATVALVNMAVDPKNSDQKIPLLKKAIIYSEKATHIHPKFGNAYFNWAVSEFDLNNIDSALILWDKGFSIFDSKPHKQIYSQLVYKRALSEGQNKNFPLAIKLLEWSVKTSPENADYWSNLGGAYFTVNRFEDAKSAWEKALLIDPLNAEANKALPFVKQKLGE